MMMSDRPGSDATPREPARGNPIELLDLIDGWAQSAPARVAHVSGDRSLTYAELRRGSDRLAHHLRRDLPDDRSPVLVIGHKEPEMLLGFLGAAKAGHPYIPIDAGQPKHRIDQIMAISGAQAAVSTSEIAAIVGREGDGPPDPEWRLRPGDALYILFTSGSTGEPKGVVVTVDSVSNFLFWTLEQQRFLAQGEVFLNQVLYSFDVSVMDSYLALLTGSTVFSITRNEVTNPRDLFAALARSNVTIWVSTPAFAAMCLVERTFGRAMLPGVRRFFLAGEALSHDLVEQLLERFPGAEVWNAYGPTEATVVVSWVNVDADMLSRYARVPIGYPMAGNRLVLLDPRDQPVPPGERGEIVIVGPSVSPGYVARPELTAKAFFPYDSGRAYRTGDWGRYIDGMLFYEGRMDDQIKLHGFRVELGDVEANLRALADVRDAVVVPVIKRGTPESLAAFVIPARVVDQPSAMSNDLKARLAERLPSYMIPRKILFVEAFPMNDSGKADRRRLAELVA